MAGIPLFVAVIACLSVAFYLSLYWNIFFIIFYFVKDKYFKMSVMLFLASIWVVLEYVRNYFLTGFPWNLLGYSQWNNIFFIQIADITGVYGVSFLLIFFNIYLTSLVNKRHFFKNTIILILLILITFLYGFFRLKKFDLNKYKKDEIKVCVLQANIDQYKKFDSQYFEYIRSRFTNLINSRKDAKIDFFVWAETSYPFLYPNNIQYFFKDVKVKSNHVMGVFTEDNKKFYNSAVFLDENLNLVDKYYKIHLVPFGEYFPMQKYIAKILPIVSTLGGVESGQKHSLFAYKNNLLAVNICFESLFPNLIRQFVKEGANVLINISNDGWYLKTSAPYQHFSFNIFRAIENRRYLIRSANTGISAVISPFGEVLASTKIYKKTCFDYVLAGINYLSFYSKFGDVFIFVCFLFIFIFLSKKIIRKSP
jgi:apolipoprotein N-acyltransferase